MDLLLLPPSLNMPHPHPSSHWLQVKAMGRGRALPPSASSASAPPADDCNSGEVDWALADTMIGTLMYAAGGPACVLKGRIQVGKKLDSG